MDSGIIRPLAYFGRVLVPDHCASFVALLVAIVAIGCFCKRFVSIIMGGSLHRGAGVLPYWIKNNEVYFLLSKEGFGRSKGTWCDFGGAKDKGETVLQTAARGCWEESRGILGTEKVIKQIISSSPHIDSKKYRLYFFRVDHPESIDSKRFLARTFSSHCRMEKTEIAWVKAASVFHAAEGNLKIQSGMFKLFQKKNLRIFFAEILRDALNTPEQRRAMQNIRHIQMPALPLV